MTPAALPIADIIAILAVLLLPLVVSLIGARRRGLLHSQPSFLTNAGRNGLLVTTAGAVAGNIGIGGFIALFLFASESPVIGFSVATVYTIGLLICAAAAPLIRRRAEEVGAIGLIDLIALTHGMRSRLFVWLPLACVFVIRSAVQLAALGLITAELFGGNAAIATLLSASIIGLYLLVGGYRAAVATDVAQAGIILIAVAVAAFGLDGVGAAQTDFFDLGAYEPAILVGIWLFLPWSPVLAVDNWQRLTVARSTRVAQLAYVIAAVLCGAVFVVMGLAGTGAFDGSVYQRFATLMPSGFTWLATAMFVACIMSSIDTFIMPLGAGLGQSQSILRLRGVIAALVAATTALAIAYADILQAVITAFNALTVFLPAAYGALFMERPARHAAAASMCTGLLAAVGFSAVDVNMGGFVGFVVAVGVYAAVTRLSR